MSLLNRKDRALIALPSAHVDQTPPSGRRELVTRSGRPRHGGFSEATTSHGEAAPEVQVKHPGGARWGPGVRPGPHPETVMAGQVWVPAHHEWRGTARTVLKVDRALVWTDQGRTTVFTLLRHYRLVQDRGGDQ